MEVRNAARARDRSVGLLHDRWRHHLSPPPQFGHGLESREIFYSTLYPWFMLRKTFEPSDLTSTCSRCTRWVFGGIRHRTQAFQSGVHCSDH
ncbi:hypothetical protein TNCV_2426271 [Trichonephila clavipes]|nr:hypothetical protein TNCV_2426271 [Trichonephila clavipes]